MNILFADQFGELGGAQQCLLELVPAVVARGWGAFALVPPEGPLAARLDSAGVQVFRCPIGTYSRGKKSLADLLRFSMDTPRLALRLRQLYKQTGASLVYVNGPRLLPAASGLPVLFHAHSLPDPLSRRLVTAAARRGTTQVIAVSRFVADALGVTATVVPNGVPDLLRPKRTKASPRIGILGRIAPEKGHLLFLEAARLLPHCRFVICGSGDGDYYQQVKANAGPNVEFLGWQDDIAEVLADLDVVAVPSAVNEAFGRTVIEGFSAKVPVVAFPSGGIPEVITDNRTGYLVPERTGPALADRLRDALAGPNQIIDNARAAWQSKYTVDAYRQAITERIALAAAQRTKTPPAPSIRPR